MVNNWSKKEIKIPIKLLKINQRSLDSYKGKLYSPQLVGEVYKKLRSKHNLKIPLNFDWGSFITKNGLLSYANPPVIGYSKVDEVTRMEISDRHLSLDCIVSNHRFDSYIKK